MLRELVRWFWLLAAVPAQGVLGLVERMLVGRRAVLDLTLDGSEDLVTRWFVLRLLRSVADDPKVEAVLLRIHGAPEGWAAAEDLRRTLLVLRKSGTPVYAWVESPGNAETWLASACERTFLAPMGEVGLVGVGAEMTFFGEALERFGVRPDFEAAGEYKSFGEPFTRTFASGANREAMGALVDDLQERLVADVAEGRRLTPEDVRARMAEAPLGPAEALEAGLVDALAYVDQLETWVEERHEGARRIEAGRWLRLRRWQERVSGWGARSVIAVVHLEGTVVMEDPRGGRTIDARAVTATLSALREQDRVGAVVLHIDSGGGSALASDLIWREVERLRDAKPVVASFAGVAASGGYYLAAPAAEILARSTTITGSIGVFGGKLVVREALRSVGVSRQGLAAAPHALMFSANQPFSDEERLRFRASLQRFYEGFVRRVAEGRRVPVDGIEPFCRGRIWSGRRAREHGLVDREGDLWDAVERARLLAGFRPGAYRVADLEPRPSPSLLVRLARAAGVGVLGALGRATTLDRGLVALELFGRHALQPMAMLPYLLRLR